MMLIEPCCATRHLLQLRDAIGKSGTKQFEGYGDLSLTELLPALLTRYCETEMLIAAPAVPDQAAEIIGKWMKKQWARKDGNGKLDVVSHLTIVSDLTKRKSPIVSGWKKEKPFGGRLTLVNRKTAEYVILMPDFAITGFTNLRYGERFVATATADTEKVGELWKRFGGTFEADGSSGETAGTETDKGAALDHMADS